MCSTSLLSKRETTDLFFNHVEVENLRIRKVHVLKIPDAVFHCNLIMKGSTL